MPKHQPSQPETTSDPIADVIVACLYDTERSWTQRVEAACRAHPHEASEIRRRLNALCDHGPIELATAPQPPPSRVGPYALIEEVGRGGQGVVYRARDDRIGREVALKVLRPHFAETPSQRMRFHREAELTAKLEDAGICTIYETDEIDGSPYIAMEYVDGEPLSRRLAELRFGETHETVYFDEDDAVEHTSAEDAIATPPALPDRDDILDLLSMIEKVARSLHTAHQAGLVHRDVKPGNIMVTSRGEPVLVDFGLARDEADDSTKLTETGFAVGTPEYMSPEQVEARALDERTDVWALGVVLYECLTLARPFTAPTRQRILDAVLHREPPSPSALNPAVPRDVVAVVQAALSKELDRRYQSAEAFADELRRVRHGEPVHARPLGVVRRSARWSRRHPWRATAFGTILALLTIAVALLVNEARTAIDLEQKNDSIRAKQLVDQIDTLHPIGTPIVEDCRHWLAVAEGIVARRETYASELAHIREGVREGAASLTPGADAFHEDMLDRLVTDIDLVRAAIPDMRDRLRRSQTHERRSIIEHARAWRECVEDVRTHASYGFVLEPIPGLVPLDCDESSDLWEFWHIESGTRPVWDDERRTWKMAPETGLIFVLVPGGTFEMGDQTVGSGAPLGEFDERPRHTVTIAPFLISKYELTQGQWLRLTGENPSRFQPGSSALAGGNYDRFIEDTRVASPCDLSHPVEQVSWDECARILWRYGLALPAERDWEFACRAGGTGVFPFPCPSWMRNRRHPPEAERVSDYGNVAGRECAVFIPATRDAKWPLRDDWAVHAPVGSFKPNAFGLFDMIGNVSEWCEDLHRPNYRFRLSAGSASRLGDSRVLRGSSWRGAILESRSASRNATPASWREAVIGVRPTFDPSQWNWRRP